MTEIKSSPNEWPVIHVYSTREAVQDGFLVEIPQETSKEAGIKFPVYLSRAVWNRYVEVPKELEGSQDISGRLWDILWLFAWHARRTTGNLLYYHLHVMFPSGVTWEQNEKRNPDLPEHRDVRLKAMIQPNDYDDPSPAIFILLPHED